jgi:ribosomal protein L14E/L6E/L27E
MNEIRTEGFAVSAAGHDAGKCYVIIHMDSEYVYLVDGRIRTLDRPKKKKKIHVRILNHSDKTMEEKIKNKMIRNEEIKRAIKLLQYVDSSKEEAMRDQSVARRCGCRATRFVFGVSVAARRRSRCLLPPL